MLQHILVIEDEPKVADTLRLGLMETGYSVDLAYTGEEGLTLLLNRIPDAVILDLNLPGRDGIEILSMLRMHHENLPVLILSARDTVQDRVQGLDTGADDYLVKPFAFPELLARLRVMLRREQQKTRLEYQIADLNVDIVARKAKRAGISLNLTPREFEILELLLRNEGRPVSRQTIARDVWRVELATPLDNVIDVHVMRLRQKLDAAFETKLIHTIRGLGFMLSDNPDT